MVYYFACFSEHSSDRLREDGGCRRGSRGSLWQVRRCCWHDQHCAWYGAEAAGFGTPHAFHGESVGHPAPFMVSPWDTLYLLWWVCPSMMSLLDTAHLSWWVSGTPHTFYGVCGTPDTFHGESVGHFTPFRVSLWDITHLSWWVSGTPYTFYGEFVGHYIYYGEYGTPHFIWWVLEKTPGINSSSYQQKSAIFFLANLPFWYFLQKKIEWKYDFLITNCGLVEN